MVGEFINTSNHTLVRKINMQAEEIQSLKRKLDENNELLTQIIRRLGHITR